PPDALHGAEDTQEVARGDAGDGVVRPAAADELGEEMREAAGILQARRRRAAEEVGADAHVPEAGLVGDIFDVIAELLERAARPWARLARPRRDCGPHVDVMAALAELVLERAHPVARLLADEVGHESGHDEA